MSERLYAWLLRLYPARFRAEFAEECMQLLRERARAEAGLIGTMRLWFDIAGDIVVSLPRQHWREHFAESPPEAASANWAAPGFASLALGPSRTWAMFMGALVTAGSLCLIPVMIHHSGGQGAAIATVRGPSEGAQAVEVGIWRQWLRQPERMAPLSPGRKPHLQHAEFQPVQPSGLSAAPKATWPQLALAGRGQSAPEGARLDATDRERLIAAITSALREHYPAPDTVAKMIAALRAEQQRGSYEGQWDGHAFAALLTWRLRAAANDSDLEVVYSAAPIPEHVPAPSPAEHALYRQRMQANHCMVEKVELLPHNIGYLKLNWFAEPEACKATVASNFAELNGASALMFDLRDNRGGEPEMIALVAAYLFDHPEYWFNPRENTTRQSWLPSPVAGNHLADKPVYVLTSARTLSGAEQFCYDLKMLKRATLVGENTGGAAHAGVFHRLDAHFGLAFREVRPINPYADRDWDGVGVAPDVSVPESEALTTALKLAEARLQTPRR